MEKHFFLDIHKLNTNNLVFGEVIDKNYSV